MRARNLNTHLPHTTFSKETALSQCKLALFLILICLSSFISAQEYPDSPTDSLSDFADILDQDTETRIREMLSTFQQSKQVEMKVVIIDSMSDYGFNGVLVMPAETTAY